MKPWCPCLEGFLDGVACAIELPGGQSGHIDSPHDDDLLPSWLRNQPLDFAFDLERAEREAVEPVTFGE